MTQVISLVASLFNLTSGGTYLKQVIKNESVPNPATWFIWFLITMLNAFTYFFITQGNVWVSLTSIILCKGPLSLDSISATFPPFFCC